MHVKPSLFRVEARNPSLSANQVTNPYEEHIWVRGLLGRQAWLPRLCGRFRLKLVVRQFLPNILKGSAPISKVAEAALVENLSHEIVGKMLAVLPNERVW